MVLMQESSGEIKAEPWLGSSGTPTDAIVDDDKELILPDLTFLSDFIGGDADRGAEDMEKSGRRLSLKDSLMAMHAAQASEEKPDSGSNGFNESVSASSNGLPRPHIPRFSLPHGKDAGPGGEGTPSRRQECDNRITDSPSTSVLTPRTPRHPFRGSKLVELAKISLLPSPPIVERVDSSSSTTSALPPPQVWLQMVDGLACGGR